MIISQRDINENVNIRRISQRSLLSIHNHPPGKTPTKRICGFDSWLVLGPVIPKTENGSDPCLHGTYDEVGTTKHNWSARCQYNVTGWVSMWAYDMLSQ